MDGVRLTEIVEKMNLKNLTPGVDITERKVHVPDVNRPALQLTGFFDHFDLNRVQIIGNVPILRHLREREKMKSMKSFWHIKYRVLYSVMIFSRNLSL